MEAPGNAAELTPATVKQRSTAGNLINPSEVNTTALSLVKEGLQLCANSGTSIRKFPGVPNMSTQ